MSDPNKMLCASCGVRKDQHGNKRKTNYCPRFVRSTQYDEPRVEIKKESPGLAAYEALKQYRRSAGLDPFRYMSVPGTIPGHFVGVNRTTAEKKDPFEPVYHRAAAGKIDYTQWVDEEDCLTDETRGGMRPVVKQRIIF